MRREILKRGLSLFVSLTMLMGLAACGSEESVQQESNTVNMETSQNETTVTEESKPEEREYVELVVYNYLTKQPGVDETLEVVNEYLKEKLNCTLDMHFYKSAEYSSTVSTMVSSGTYMDMVLTGASRVSFPTYAAMNAFAPLEDYVDEYLVNTKSVVPESAWEAYTINGHLYAVPLPRDFAQNFNYKLNQTLADDLGVTFPEKYDTVWDLIDFFYEAKAARDAKYPDKANQPITKWHTAKLNPFYYYEQIISNNHMVVANIPGLSGFEGMGDGETVFCPYFTEEYREYAKLTNQLVKDGIVDFDFKNYDKDKVIEKAGELLGFFGQGDIYYAEDTMAPYYMTTMHKSVNATLATSGLQAGGYAISAQSEHVERCLEVIDLFNSDPYLATIMRFGPEGIGWTDENNDNIIEVTDINSDAANRYHYYWYQWNLGGLSVSKVAPGYPENFAELLTELNNTATPTSNVGFNMDQNPVANEIAACASVIAEYDGILSSGQNDKVDQLVDEFVAKLKANGMEKIVEEAQRQVNEWRMAKGLKTK